ncbi:MAG: START-like domain-containing protein [Chitinophagales bacterium]
MARKKYNLEYIIRSSPAILFEFVTNPSNLAQWFSDTCDANDNFIAFGWGGAKEQAEILEYIQEEFVKYRWIDGKKDEFFSFRIYKSEIANDTILEITDFAEDREIKDQMRLWDSQIDELKHQLGAA